MLLIIISVHVIIKKTSLPRVERYLERDMFPVPDPPINSGIDANDSMHIQQEDELFTYLFKDKQFANIPTAEDFPSNMFKNIDAYEATLSPYMDLTI